ncbi:MAG TPA: LacI family DNA-binding transcriptional regulator [Luteitalea sp.]|nr:LacI family DNA-binding transcriptional regulator [Luteitalea sp.]
MAKGKKIRLQDLARAAGVSGATVSRVVNRTGKVSPALEARVQRVADRLKLDLAARVKPRLIGFVLGNRPLLHPFHSRILAGCEAACVEQGYHVVFLSLNYRPDTPAEALDIPRVMLRQDILDGFVLAGIHSQNLLDRLAQTSAAVAVQGNNVQRPWHEGRYDAVYYDDVEGGYAMTRHLQGLGHRDIWFVGNRQYPWFDRCYDGYARAMSEADTPARVVAPDCEAPREAGYRGTISLLAEGTPVTAIFAGSDATAQGVYEAVREAGLRVPEDISVGGLDDIEAGTMHPRLDTVRIELEDVGRALADCVMSRLEAPHLEGRRVMIPTTLVTGASSAPPRRARMARARRA